jgi:hypothetical protein
LIFVQFYLRIGDTNSYGKSYSQPEISYAPKNSSTSNIYTRSPSWTHLPGNYSEIARNGTSSSRKQNIWVSMGLCFEKNTELYGKKTYPYTKITPLAIMLWNYFLPSVKVILYIVYGTRTNEKHRLLYDSQLRKNVDMNVVEIRWVEEEDINCPMKSQLIRMWAFQETSIGENDIIVTVDANLFVMTPKILDPIHQNPNMKIWIFQYDRGAFKKQGIGETFNQNLIATKAKGTLLKFVLVCR